MDSHPPSGWCSYPTTGFCLWPFTCYWHKKKNSYVFQNKILNFPAVPCEHFSLIRFQTEWSWHTKHTTSVKKKKKKHIKVFCELLLDSVVNINIQFCTSYRMCIIALSSPISLRDLSADCDLCSKGRKNITSVCNINLWCCGAKFLSWLDSFSFLTFPNRSDKHATVRQHWFKKMQHFEGILGQNCRQPLQISTFVLIWFIFSPCPIMAGFCLFFFTLTVTFYTSYKWLWLRACFDDTSYKLCCFLGLLNSKMDCRCSSTRRMTLMDIVHPTRMTSWLDSADFKYVL